MCILYTLCIAVHGDKMIIYTSTYSFYNISCKGSMYCIDLLLILLFDSTISIYLVDLKKKLWSYPPSQSISLGYILLFILIRGNVQRPSSVQVNYSECGSLGMYIASAQT